MVYTDGVDRLPIDAAVERLKADGRVPMLLLAYNVEEAKLEAYMFNDQVPDEVRLVLKKHKLNLDIRPLS